ncbi:MAG: glyoxalase [Myxococcales bacterium]|nr:glyoxalase [Myxococcales bacterium]
MIAQSVHHVSLTITDLERSRAFYEGILGLEPIPRPEMGLGGIWYGAGTAEIHLIVAPEGVDVGKTPPANNPVAPHLAFAIDDWQKTRDALAAHGLDLLAPSAEMGQMWVQDPDGYVLEFIVPRTA